VHLSNSPADIVRPHAAQKPYDSSSDILQSLAISTSGTWAPYLRDCADRRALRADTRISLKWVSKRHALRNEV
jgi:hypothetical protein